MIDAPVGVQCPVCAGGMPEGAVGQAAYRARTRIEQTQTGRRIAAASITRLLIIANVAVAIPTLLPGALPGLDLLDRGALFNPLPPGEWWRVVTSMFLHVNIMHIAFNMYALNSFGPAMEERYGKVRYGVLYLLTGLGGAAATLGLSEVRASVGASGAIFGLFGAWFAFFYLNRDIPGARDQLRSLLGLLAINLVFGFAVQGINNYAHGGGLVTGFVLVLAFERARRLGRWVEVASVAAISLGFAWVFAARTAERFSFFLT